MESYSFEDDEIEKRSQALAVFAESFERDFSRIVSSSDAYMQEHGRNMFSEASHQDRKRNIFGQIEHLIRQSFNHSLDLTHYMVAFLQFQTSRYQRLKQTVSGLSSHVDYTVKVKIDKNMRFGDRNVIIRDSETYLREVRRAAAGLRGAAVLAEELASVAAGGYLMAMRDVAIGNNFENAQELYERFSGEIHKAIRTMGLKPTNEEKSFRVFASPELMLGGIQPTATLPPADNEKPENIRDLRQALARTGFYMYRADKIQLRTMFEGSVELTFSQKQLKELFEIGEGLVKDIAALNGAGKRLSTVVSQFLHWFPRMFSGHVSGGRDLDFPQAHMQFGFVAFRAASRLDIIVLDTLSTTYHAGMGLSKKIATIIEKAR